MVPSVSKLHKVGGGKSRLVASIPDACRDEAAAVAFLEEQRWGKHPSCPRCGTLEPVQMKAKDGTRNARFLWRCNACHEQFTVRIGTVMEDSRIPFRFWCLAFYRACASKKGISALQIKRETGLSYKSALFLMHRARWAMTDSGSKRPPTGIVEVDETYIAGKRKGGKVGRGTDKASVVALVERRGRVQTRHVERLNADNLKGTIRELVSRQATIMTDEFKSYIGIGREFEGGHRTVRHSVAQYVDGINHVNTVESFFALLKRGIHGTFHSVSKPHLHRYLSEFEFRYNWRKVDDGERTRQAIRGSEGKQLRYRAEVHSRRK
jgi:transposase-like protein